MSSQRLTKPINAPYEGVSQAPPQVALSGSCRAMDNCLSVIPQGVTQRPPLEWVKKLFPSQADGFTLFHLIPRGTPSADLLLAISWEASTIVPRLFNYDTLAPVALTIQAEALAYLADAIAPNVDLHVLSVEDTTFITNRLRAVGVTSSTAPARPFEGVIWVKTGGYGQHYSITVTPVSGTPVTVTYTTANGSVEHHVYGVRTEGIAHGLYDGTLAGLPWGDSDPTISEISTATLIDLVSQGFTVTLDGSTIYLAHDTVDFSISISDDAGGTGIVGIKGSVQRFSDLPIQAHDGFTVRIAQEAAGQDSDYYVSFLPQGSTTTGIWTEVLAPGAPLGLDSTTMPIRLFNHGTEGSPDWHLEQPTWGQRTTGTQVLSPDPSFVGDQIQALAWALGRLVVVATGEAVLSASDDPFKFYRTTLAAVLDSDPIGLLSPAPTKAFFRDAATFNEKLVIFADNAQCTLTTGTPVSPSSAKLTLFSTSPYSNQLPLREVQGKIYYAASTDGRLGVYEFQLDRLAGNVVPKVMTAGVPTYLPVTLDRSAVYKQGYMAVYGTSGSAYLYPHLFRYDGPDSVQNSWSRWTLPDGYVLMGLTSRGSILTVYVRHMATGQGHVLRMDLAPAIPDAPTARTSQKLDFKVSSADLPTPTFDGALTTFLLPYPFLPTAMDATVRAGSTHYPEGYLPSVHSDGIYVYLMGDWRTEPLWFGLLYRASFTPHIWYAPNSDGAPRLDGKLTIAKLVADMAAFSYLRAEVFIKGRAPRTTEFQGNYLDDPDTPLDQVPISPTAQLRIAVGGLNKDVTVTFVNDSHLGFQFMGYAWEGNYNAQASQS